MIICTILHDLNFVPIPGSKKPHVLEFLNEINPLYNNNNQLQMFLNCLLVH